MSTLEERTPDDLLDELIRVLDQVRDRLPVIRAELDRLIRTPDPLAEFRLPSGQVAFETVHADDIRAGDWVQRCHGDPDWHHVEDVAPLPGGLDGGQFFTRIAYDGLAHDWRATDAIRVARTPAHIQARWGR